MIGYRENSRSTKREHCNTGDRKAVSQRKGETLKRTKRFLSFSNVIAVIALFFALGGTVYAAGKISGTEIKAKSIPGNRVKPKSLTATQIKPGSLTGKQVKAGSITGTQILESSLTGVSASSLSIVQYAVATVALPSPSPTNGTTATATCPVGQKVIGGGALVSNDAEAIVNDSAPTLNRSGWEATGYGFIPGLSMTVTAICTPVVTAAG